MNTIKTKIGFDTKPYIIQTIDFRELLSISGKTYGQILLVFASLLSVGSCFYLQSTQKMQSYQLLLLQQEKAKLEAHHHQLTIEHEDLTSMHRLQSLGAQINMHQPTSQNVICIPQYPENNN